MNNPDGKGSRPGSGLGCNIPLHADRWEPGSLGEDPAGIVNRSSDASDAAQGVDGVEEGALLRGEAGEVLGLDRRKHGNAAAHHVWGDLNRVQADGITGPRHHLSAPGTEAVGDEAAGPIEQATDVVSPEACGAAAESVDDGSENASGFIGASPRLQPTGPAGWR